MSYFVDGPDKLSLLERTKHLTQMAQQRIRIHWGADARVEFSLVLSDQLRTVPSKWADSVRSDSAYKDLKFNDPDRIRSNQKMRYNIANPTQSFKNCRSDWIGP